MPSFLSISIALPAQTAPELSSIPSKFCHFNNFNNYTLHFFKWIFQAYLGLNQVWVTKFQR
jgi:hypothetical protein